MVGCESKYSLYDQDLVTFKEGAVAYDQRDAAGFITLNALRSRTLAQRKNELGLWGSRHLFPRRPRERGDPYRVASR